MNIYKLSQQFLEKSEPKYAGFIFYCYDDNTIFMMKRSPNTSNPNVWSLPGGHMDEGETPLQAAIRECKEETGKVPKHKVIDSLLQGNYMNYIAGIKKEDKDNWDPKLDWENVEYKWFDIDSLPDELHPGFVRTLRQIVTDKVMQ